MHLEKNFKIDLRDALQECSEDWDLFSLAKPEKKSKYLLLLREKIYSQRSRLKYLVIFWYAKRS